MKTKKRTFRIVMIAIVMSLLINNAFSQSKTIIKNREIGLTLTPMEGVGAQIKWGKKQNKYWRFTAYSASKAENAFKIAPSLSKDNNRGKIGYSFTFGREKRINLGEKLQFGIGLDLAHTHLNGYWTGYFSFESWGNLRFYNGRYNDYGLHLPLFVNYSFNNVVLSAGLTNKLMYIDRYEQWTSSASAKCYVYNTDDYFKSTRDVTVSVAWKFSKTKTK